MNKQFQANHRAVATGLMHANTGGRGPLVTAAGLFAIEGLIAFSDDVEADSRAHCMIIEPDLSRHRAEKYDRQ